MQDVSNSCVLVHQYDASLCRQSVCFAMIFRESAKYIEIILYSQK